jgi:hypothetical protein
MGLCKTLTPQHSTAHMRLSLTAICCTLFRVCTSFSLTMPPLLLHSQSRQRSFSSGVCHTQTEMGLSSLAFHFDFPTVPYAVGLHHIHSPEKMAERHGLGAPLFRVDSTQPPSFCSSAFVSIAFVCSTAFMQHMHVRMYTSQPDVSHMLFFNQDRAALYRVKLSVTPLKVCFHLALPLQGASFASIMSVKIHDACACNQAFTAHRLHMEVTFFEAGTTRLRSLLPIFHFVDALEHHPPYPRAAEDPHFKSYRRSVLRGHNSDDFWIMAERVWRKYAC